MTATIFGSSRDLRNWIDNATSGWDNRTDTDVDTILSAISADDHPRYGDDWTEYLATLDLMALAE